MGVVVPVRGLISWAPWLDLVLLIPCSEVQANLFLLFVVIAPRSSPSPFRIGVWFRWTGFQVIVFLDRIINTQGYFRLIPTCCCWLPLISRVFPSHVFCSRGLSYHYFDCPVCPLCRVLLQSVWGSKLVNNFPFSELCLRELYPVIRDEVFRCSIPC